jgi:hypothetical protein
MERQYDPTLDLVNTEVIVAEVRTDLLQSFSDLTQWFEQANLASQRYGRTLQRPEIRFKRHALCAVFFGRRWSESPKRDAYWGTSQVHWGRSCSTPAWRRKYCNPKGS